MPYGTAAIPSIQLVCEMYTRAPTSLEEGSIKVTTLVHGHIACVETDIKDAHISVPWSMGLLLGTHCRARTSSDACGWGCRKHQ
eukprot:m.264805 g.264805  ORF g.264805 m.264805 type:complete len:84 (+) comp15623_c0_seq1:63-314(+)